MTSAQMYPQKEKKDRWIQTRKATEEYVKLAQELKKKKLKKLAQPEPEVKKVEVKKVEKKVEVKKASKQEKPVKKAEEKPKAQDKKQSKK